MNAPNDIRAWVVSADMGYGHRRAVHPLRDIAEGDVLVVGKNDGALDPEKHLWARALGGYEFFSRARGIPVIGRPTFGILDALMKIPSPYPIRDLSSSTLQVELLASSVRKGLCSGMLSKIEQKHLPLVTSFYAPAVAADMAGHDSIFCIVCDADLNRVWVAKNPWESRINYLAPCGRAAQRLKAYGVSEERIFLTGFPLPTELTGADLEILKKDLGQRLVQLDPRNRFWKMHGRSVEHFLGEENCGRTRTRPLTITYAVGGAGAQKEFGGRLVRSLDRKLKNGSARVNLVAGVRREVKEYFDGVRDTSGHQEQAVRVVYSESMEQYFEEFNALMHDTDILWTKPSELSFYAALGIPIVMSPTIGSQEKFNRRWLREVQAGIPQENPDYVDQWLYDALDDGRLADAAWSGFLKARKLGTEKILTVLKTGVCPRGDSPLKR
jgi:hypothetical protein